MKVSLLLYALLFIFFTKAALSSEDSPKGDFNMRYLDPTNQNDLSNQTTDIHMIYLNGNLTESDRILIGKLSASSLSDNNISSNPGMYFLVLFLTIYCIILALSYAGDKNQVPYLEKSQLYLELIDNVTLYDMKSKYQRDWNLFLAIKQRVINNSKMKNFAGRDRGRVDLSKISQTNPKLMSQEDLPVNKNLSNETPEDGETRLDISQTEEGLLKDVENSNAQTSIQENKEKNNTEIETRPNENTPNPEKNVNRLSSHDVDLIDEILTSQDEVVKSLSEAGFKVDGIELRGPLKRHPGIERVLGIRRFPNRSKNYLEYSQNIPKNHKTMKLSRFSPEYKEEVILKKINKIDFFEQNMNYRIIKAMEETTLKEIYLRKLLSDSPIFSLYCKPMRLISRMARTVFLFENILFQFFFNGILVQIFAETLENSIVHCIWMCILACFFSKIQSSIFIFFFRYTEQSRKDLFESNPHNFFKILMNLENRMKVREKTVFYISLHFLMLAQLIYLLILSASFNGKLSSIWIFMGLAGNSFDNFLIFPSLSKILQCNNL